MEPRRLYRSQKNKVIAGVCGGYAEYFDVDPVIMRLLFVLLAFVGGSGFLIYLVSMILLPKYPFTVGDVNAVNAAPAPVSKFNIRYVFGGMLVFFGLIFLLTNLGIFEFMHAWDISWNFIFPILLILLGMAIIYYRQNEQIPEVPANAAEGEAAAQARPTPPRQLRRSLADRKLFGVCGGLAAYFSIDPNLTRILYVVLCLATGGAGILLYIVLALVVPDDRFVKTQW
jgi:phage shock protein C